MKSYLFITTLFISFIHTVFSFPESRLPEDTIIVAKDGSGNFETVSEKYNTTTTNNNNNNIIIYIYIHIFIFFKKQYIYLHYLIPYCFILYYHTTVLINY